MSKTVLVVGASGDIGTACVKVLAASGWNVVCHYHKSFQKVLKIVEELRSKYRLQDFFMVSLNLLDEGQIPKFLDNLFGIDAVIFASGFTYYKLLKDHTSREMEELWQIHLKTPAILLQNLQDKLSMSKQGRIVFIGSVYSEMGSSMETIYSALKGAQVSFVKSYAKEVATLGITANVVAPGAVDTKMNENWTASELADLKDKIPLQRLAEVSEIATVVDFLISEKTSYLTGSVITVAGGWC